MRMTTVMGRIRGMITTLVCGAVVAISGTAQAQFRGMGGDLFNPPVSNRELDKIAELLGMDEVTTELAESMLDAMETEWEKQRDEMREIMNDAREEFRDTRDFAVWEDLRPIMEDFGEKREAMEEAFLADVKLLLTEEQTEEWPRVDRMLLRQRSLRDGLLSGEAVDLIELIKELEMSEGSVASLRPVLDQYELEMHRALEHRNEVFESSMNEGMSLFRDQDFETIEKLFAKSTEAAERVRDTNRRYARQLGQMLNEDERVGFESRYQEQSFPRVYRDAWVMTAASSAETFDDLTVDQRESVADIRAAYQREARVVNERWAKAIQEAESNRTFQDMFRGGPQSDETREARDARRDLDERFEEQLLGILNEDQIDRLPEKERRNFRERGRDRFQRGDRGNRGERGQRRQRDTGDV